MMPEEGEDKVMLRGLVLKSRSFRRFFQHKRISQETLVGLVELARVTPSARNRQPLKYYLACQEDINQEIYSCLGWAGYLAGWDGPPEGERPGAYIVILGDTGISKEVGCDHGIAAQTMMLGAAEKGLGGCMIGTIDRPRLRQKLCLPGPLEILLVLALGVPREEVVLEAVAEDGDIRYWRDKEGVHHVPKRKLEDIIITT